MSRIGNHPIPVPPNVTVNIGPEKQVSIKGPKGALVQSVCDQIGVTLKENLLLVSKLTEQKNIKALHGLYRVLLNNMVVGVTKGFKKSLQIVGVGYKAAVQQGILELHLGKSHAIYMAMPEQITVDIEVTKGKRSSTYVHIQGIDKQLVGQVAAKIREQKPPEPFIGKRANDQKGIRYVGELLIGKNKKDGK